MNRWRQRLAVLQECPPEQPSALQVQLSPLSLSCPLIDLPICTNASAGTVALDCPAEPKLSDSPLIPGAYSTSTVINVTHRWQSIY